MVIKVMCYCTYLSYWDDTEHYDWNDCNNSDNQIHQCTGTYNMVLDKDNSQDDICLALLKDSNSHPWKT